MKQIKIVYNESDDNFYWNIEVFDKNVLIDVAVVDRFHYNIEPDVLGLAVEQMQSKYSVPGEQIFYPDGSTGDPF